MKLRWFPMRAFALTTSFTPRIALRNQLICVTHEYSPSLCTFSQKHYTRYPFPSSIPKGWYPHYTSTNGSSVAPTSSSKYIQDTSSELPSFSSKKEYLQYLLEKSDLPDGFATGTTSGTFVPQEAPAMGALPIKCTVIYLTDGPTQNWAATFTSNKFPGAPVHIGRSRLSSQMPLQALVINNKVSNVCCSSDGIDDAESVCDAVSQALNLSRGYTSVLPVSTGVIGWRIPTKELCEMMVPNAVKKLQTKTALYAARGIMTTDRFPKVRSRTLSNGARIVGIVKGAGMIEPNMATMLCFLLTDASLPKSTLQSMLSDVVNESFNSISVDGDESTSDTAVLLSSNRVDMSIDKDNLIVEFHYALSEVVHGLASDLVRNGEGTRHVMRVHINHFPGTERDARKLGRHIVDSPLFKCAVSGNDPNIGRLAGAVGSFLGQYISDIDTADLQNMVMKIGGRVIFQNGIFIQGGDGVERELSEHMKMAEFDEHDEFPRHQRFVEIGIDFGIGNGTMGTVYAVVLGSDLTNDYVAINADYRS